MNEHARYFQSKISADQVAKAVARIVRKGDGLRETSPIGRSLTVPAQETLKPSSAQIKPAKTSSFEQQKVESKRPEQQQQVSFFDSFSAKAQPESLP